jgi:hypothetical protein
MKKYWISKHRIAHHISLCGVTGTGKSTIMRQLAYQFLEAGMPCVFFDIKRDFLAEFWRPGDWILDPGDMRCPRWALNLETQDEMRATALAHSAFPDEPRDTPFFKKNPRALLAYLLGRFKPTTDTLADWMANDNEIDQRVQGCDVAGMLHKQSGGMREGILATFKEFGRSLRLWPTDPALPYFAVQEWARQRRGNIFLTSNPDTLDALRPVQSMLLDMIILGMQSHPGPGALILDEVAQLQRLPKLETAISLQRAAGNPILLSFQDVSLLKVHYGELWKAIVSQPYTQIVFRTSEEEAAKHAAGILGQAQIERIRESRQAMSLFFHRPHRNYQQERVTEYTVMPGEIQSLPDGHGYLAQEGCVVPLKIPWKKPVIRAERLIPRVLQTPLPPIPPAGTTPIAPYRVRRKQMSLTP